jgi:hypothetical protein
MDEKAKGQPDYEVVEDLEAPVESQEQVEGGRPPWCSTVGGGPSGPTGAEAC